MARRCWSALGNRQKLDGGSMFGNAPRALWERWAPADALHRIDLACRCLVVEDGTRTVLFEAGIGAFFPPALRTRYGVQESEHRLLEVLAARGLRPEDIDVVVLSHLHFDHAGGLLETYQEGEPLRLVFPKAQYVVGKDAFARAVEPHLRDRASFIPELPGLLQRSGRLELVDSPLSKTLGADVRFHRSDGHSPGMLLAEIAAPDGPLLFCGDLVPGLPWVRAAITMGYDRFPEKLIDEKVACLDDLASRHGRLFFTHDPSAAVARLVRSDDGRLVAAESVAEWEE